MPEKLPRITAKQVSAVLEKCGFVLVRQSGSHLIYRNKSGKRTTVPLHTRKTLHPKLLMSILKDAEMSVEDLKDLLRKRRK
ncbi:MAG: type II toxin-antitoxin system HicA family toxin [bacterium]|nr:type II toxin-antitoxin system HicA family toxin [bacterium]MDZ4296517.1 type II toxin-antitoxin system HicA family toxin [Patescibacteria group bacterium]